MILIKINECSSSPELNDNERMKKLEQDVNLILTTWYDFKTELENEIDDRFKGKFKRILLTIYITKWIKQWIEHSSNANAWEWKSLDVFKAVRKWVGSNQWVPK